MGGIYENFSNNLGQNTKEVYMNITRGELPTISLKILRKYNLLPDPRKRERKEGSIKYTISYICEVGVYLFNLTSYSNGEGRGEIEIKYQYEGREFTYSIPLVVVQSNLPSGGEYFVFHYKGKRFDKLFFSGGLLYTRRSLPPDILYIGQSLSKDLRLWEKEVGTTDSINTLFRKGGKIYYRDSLTRYGRKLLKNYPKIRAFFDFNELPEVWRRQMSILDTIAK